MNSFREDFKDPESGRVISFNDSELVYTATNLYGARVQGKALCRQIGNKWERDRGAEYLKILLRSSETLRASNACLEAGKRPDECSGDSAALKRSRGSAVDAEALNKESAQALGF